MLLDISRVFRASRKIGQRCWSTYSIHDSFIAVRVGITAAYKRMTK